VYDAFTSIHETQVVGSDPTDSFAKLLNQIVEEQDVSLSLPPSVPPLTHPGLTTLQKESQEFLKRADETLKKYRKQLLNHTTLHMREQNHSHSLGDEGSEETSFN
jgi:hypothetical protein